MDLSIILSLLFFRISKPQLKVYQSISAEVLAVVEKNDKWPCHKQALELHLKLDTLLSKENIPQTPYVDPKTGEDFLFSRIPIR